MLSPRFTIYFFSLFFSHSFGALIMKSLWKSCSLAALGITALCSAPALWAQSSPVQEQRVTERRTVTGEDGKTERTSSIIERKVEDITPPTKHLIYAAPVRMIWMANIGYMHSLSDKFAVGGNLELPTSIDSRVLRGFGIAAEGRFYPGANGLRGFYIAPGLNLHTFTANQYDYNANPVLQPNGTWTTPQPRQITVTPFSLALIGGWVFNWGDLSLDFGLGFKTHLSNGVDPTTVTSTSVVSERGLSGVGLDSFSGTMPVFRINVGYSW